VGDAGGEGVLAQGLPLQQGVNSLPGDMGETVRAMLAGMGTVCGGGKRVLSVTCDAPELDLETHRSAATSAVPTGAGRANLLPLRLYS
jgi:hypothetical protein